MSNRKEFRPINWLIAVIVLMCGSMPAAAETHSSPHDRGRFVSIARNLENSPLGSSLQADRQWALAWLTNAPDVSVTICDDPLGGVVTSEYAYAPEILVQYMFSMAARVIEQPETTQNPNAIQLAGVEGALNAYRAILREKPGAKSPALEEVLQSKARGELPDFVRKAFDTCIAKEVE